MVSEESSRSVVAALVSLARAFSANTVAEGAEDMQTVEVLKSLGVNCVQGYALGRPVPLEEAFGARVAASTREAVRTSPGWSGESPRSRRHGPLGRRVVEQVAELSDLDHAAHEAARTPQ